MAAAPRPHLFVLAVASLALVPAMATATARGAGVPAAAEAPSRDFMVGTSRIRRNASASQPLTTESAAPAPVLVPSGVAAEEEVFTEIIVWVNANTNATQANTFACPPPDVVEQQPNTTTVRADTNAGESSFARPGCGVLARPAPRAAWRGVAWRGVVAALQHKVTTAPHTKERK